MILTLTEHVLRKGCIVIAETGALYGVLHLFRVAERRAQRLLLALTLALCFSLVHSASPRATATTRATTATGFISTPPALRALPLTSIEARTTLSHGAPPHPAPYSPGRAPFNPTPAAAAVIIAAPLRVDVARTAIAARPRGSDLFNWLASPLIRPVPSSIGGTHLASLSVSPWTPNATVDDMLRRGHAILAANPHVVGFAFSPGWGLQVYTAAGMPLTRAGGWSAYLRDATPGALEQRTAAKRRTAVWDAHTMTVAVGATEKGVLWSCNGASACGATKAELLRRAVAYAAIDPRVAVISIAACKSWHGFQVRGVEALPLLERRDDAGSWAAYVLRGSLRAPLPTAPPTQPPTPRRDGAAAWSNTELRERGCDCVGGMEHAVEAGNAPSSVAARTLTLTSRQATLDTATHARFTRRFPGYTIQHFSDAEVLAQLAAWGETSALRAVRKLRHGVSVADVFRLIAVYHRGGFYMDVKSGFKCGRDVRCVEEVAAKARASRQGLADAWFVAPTENWAFFGEAKSTVLRHVIDAIVGEINSCTKPHGKSSSKFDARVLAHTGPHAIARHLASWARAHPGARPARLDVEEACFTYDVRGGMASWTAPGSYHLVGDDKSVYANGACVA